MKIFLVRHGEAVSEVVDPAKPLSEKGRQEVERVAAILTENGAKVERIFHSGKKRAEETAEILAKVVLAEGSTKIGRRDGLNPGDEVEPVARWIEGMADIGEDVMVVGHLPFMGYLASELVFGNTHEEVVNFSTATVVCLERLREKKWVIQFVIKPEMR